MWVPARGGGSLAARLAKAGQKVLLLKAGGDPRDLSGGDPNNPDKNDLADDYDLPVFHFRQVKPLKI